MFFKRLWLLALTLLLFAGFLMPVEYAHASETVEVLYVSPEKIGDSLNIRKISTSIKGLCGKSYREIFLDIFWWDKNRAQKYTILRVTRIRTAPSWVVTDAYDYEFTYIEK